MAQRPRYYRPRAERMKSSTLKPNQRRAPAWNARVKSSAVALEVLTLTSDRPLILRDGPTNIQTDVGANELSAVLSNETTLEITYDASVAAATEVLFPNQTDNVRTVDGGFLITDTFPLLV